jgi:[acyl-carrier-protein] S-malonyltransferase
MSKLAFVFPGQGSQKVGMLADLEQKNKQVSDTFAEASDVLGYDMWKMVQEGPQEEINLTERTQPILLASSVAIWRIWLDKQGHKPSFMAGHSLGEWSALVCSETVSFSDALNIVQARGQYMQKAVPVGEGAMAAIIGLEDAIIIEACQSASEIGVVDAVNFNAPGQVVIAGSISAVNQAIEECKQAGAKRALPLPVSAPFHTSLMKPAADQLSELVNSVTFKRPSVPVVHNVHAETEENPDTIKTLMLEQIYKPVRWVDCVKTLRASDVNTLVECGPGKVLSGLNKRIDKELLSLATDDQSSFEATLSQL